MAAAFSICISILALSLSALTAWLMLFRKGRVEMTRPTVIAFAHDGDERVPKIYLRTLLYCTAERGQVVESMYANLRHKNTTTTFAFWGYGEKSNLKSGGGLFVGRQGVAEDHHFVLLSKSGSYKYVSGEYVVEVFSKLVGETSPHKLSEITVSITDEMAELMNSQCGGVMFNWNPNTQTYKGELSSPRIDMAGVIGPTIRRENRPA